MRTSHNIRCGEEALEYLLLYSWPGNVRQLSNEVRRFVALAEADSVVTPEDLSAEIQSARHAVAVTAGAAPASAVPRISVRLDQPLGAAMAEVERALIAHALCLSEGQVSQAAEKLRVSRKGLFLKRRRLGLAGSSTAA